MVCDSYPTTAQPSYLARYLINDSAEDAYPGAWRFCQAISLQLCLVASSVGGSVSWVSIHHTPSLDKCAGMGFLLC
jgi:hypothetical protein